MDARTVSEHVLSYVRIRGSDDPGRRRRANPYSSDARDVNRVRSVLCLPLINRAGRSAFSIWKTIGSLRFSHLPVSPRRAIASQAAISIDNARYRDLAKSDPDRAAGGRQHHRNIIWELGGRTSRKNTRS